jgi:hypothetical protein
VQFSAFVFKFPDIWPFLKFAVVPVLAWLAFSRARHIQQNQWRFAARLGAGSVSVLSTLLLVLSLPTGSIDISNLWRFLAFGLLPIIPLVGLMLARKIKLLWIRVTVRTVASLFYPSGPLSSDHVPCRISVY